MLKIGEFGEIRQPGLRFRHLALGTVLAGVLACLSVQFAPRVYHKIKVKRLARSGALSLAKGDYHSALLEARKALDIDPKNAPATRIVAASLDAVGAPDAILWRRRLDQLQPGDAENLIAFAKETLQAGDPTSADLLLKNVGVASQSNAQYHDVAAQLAASRGDAQGAISHWKDAAKIDPSERRYSLSVAAFQLKSTNGDVRAAALESLDRFRADPKTRLAATRLLLQDAANQGNSDKVHELARILDNDPKATIQDKLVQLSAFRVVDDPDFLTKLEQLQAASTEKPQDIVNLIAWMNDHNLAIAVSEWVSKLPPELVSKPPVSIAVADALALGSDWNRLKTSLEASPPDRLDFFRMALQSRMLKQQGDEHGAQLVWQKSLAAASTRRPWLEQLARVAIDRGWQQESEDALWALSEWPDCPRWALDALFQSALHSRDTMKMYRAARLLFQAASLDPAVRNTFVYLSLLTHSGQDNPDALAEALYNENPGKPIPARIYALSLYQRGKKVQAEQVMAALPADSVAEPVSALCYGVCLAGTGQFDKSRKYLQIAETVNLLTEEKALLAKAQEALRADANRVQTEAATGGL